MSDPRGLRLGAGSCDDQRMKPLVTLSVLALVSVVACDAPPEVQPEVTAASSATQSAPKRQLPSARRPVSAATPNPTASATAPVEAKGPFPESTDPNLKDVAKASVKAPAKFTVKFETTVGDFDVECTRDWAPIAVDRFYSLVKINYFDDVAFFRVVQKPEPFVVQFGIHGNPEVSAVWKNANLDREDVKQSNTRGTLTFAMSGQTDTPKKTTATRSTQLFFNYGDNSRLDDMGFAPLC
ncbi:MAG: peptidylprolyl isomerase, partial [Myxococcales bacterium]|nr:peptidylprolyl isomerase [Myxococcales bacterium]